MPPEEKIRHDFPVPRGLVVGLLLAALLVCPIYLFYSRVFMIESTALCLAAWFVVFLDRTLDRPLGWALPATWLFGTLAALTKVTTLAAFWIACALLVLERIAARRR